MYFIVKCLEYFINYIVYVLMFNKFMHIPQVCYALIRNLYYLCIIYQIYLVMYLYGFITTEMRYKKT